MLKNILGPTNTRLITKNKDIWTELKGAKCMLKCMLWCILNVNVV